MRPATRVVHLPQVPYPPAVGGVPFTPPVFHASTYEVPDAATLGALLADEVPGYSYGRVDHPTVDAFAAAVAGLEAPDGSAPDAVVGQAFASGMAATTTVLLALLAADDEVIAPASCYGGTYALLTGIARRCGIGVRWVDPGDAAAVAAAVGERTRLLWVEAFANPTMGMPDLPALVDVARRFGLVLAVDATFASPAMLRPLEHGADLVVHSATKYLGGHSDATGGVVVGGRPLVDRVRATRIELGTVLGPDEAYLLHRGLATLELRVARQCATAVELAGLLAEQPEVVAVLHPSRPDHPSHDLARRLCDPGRCGAVVSFTVRGGAQRARQVADQLRLIRAATSLGGVHSTISHPASTSHRQLDETALAAAGIAAGTLRLSVGIEDPADLAEDLLAALGS